MKTSKRKPYLLDQTVTHRLHTLSKLTDSLTHAAYLAEVQMPLGEGRCLAAIGAFAPLSVNHLALQANLNKGQASRAAQTLVEQGLVVKKASEIDGRGVVLTLTAAGDKVFRRVAAIIDRRNAEVVSCLTLAERHQLSRILDRLVAHARTAIDEVRDPED